MSALATAVALSLVAASSASAAPNASFSFQPNAPIPGQSVTFKSTSSSTGTNIVDYSWDLDGDNAFGAAGEPHGPAATTATRSFAVAGNYTVRLQVTDDVGAKSTASRTVAVKDPPVAPPAAPREDGDDDDDGVVGRADLCPVTEAGVTPLAQGCSLLDLVVSPAALIGPAGQSVERARGALGTLKELRRGGRRPGKKLTKGFRGIQAAAQKLDSSPCGAARKANKSLRGARTAASAIAHLVKSKQRNVKKQATRFLRSHSEAVGDAGSFETLFYRLAYRTQLARQAVSDLGDLKGLMTKACRASGGERKLSGHVTEVSGSVARLDNGAAVALGAVEDLRGMVPGAAVTVRGIKFGKGAVVADSVVPDGLGAGPSLGCSFVPRIAPVQNFDLANSKILYHDRRGYLDGSGYQLEEGMGIGAAKGGCAGKDVYALSVFLDYTNAFGVEDERLLGVLFGTPASEPPVRIPMDVDPNTRAATLRFELVGIDCPGSDLGSCGGPEVISDTPTAASVRQQGEWGAARYDETQFSVEDGSTTDFDTATLLNGIAPGLPGATVSGVGFSATPESSYPDYEFILPGDSLAVHDDVPTASVADYYDPNPGIPGGLFWANVRGFRSNDFPYQYVARLPDIVTDAVSVCPGSTPDSFYRLPWKDGTTEQVTQGNSTSGSHSVANGQPFAWDFVMPQFTPGIATRGGIADMVVENRTLNVSANPVGLWLPGNVLRVVHQDGTFSWYEHMIPSGVIPARFDVIERGDPVIVVGNTGNATGPHLHYHVTVNTGADTGPTPTAPLGTNPSRGGTIPITFELAIPSAPNLAIPCFTPGKGSYVSTNS